MRERNLGSMTASVGLGVVLLLAVACTSSSIVEHLDHDDGTADHADHDGEPLR